MTNLQQTLLVVTICLMALGEKGVLILTHVHMAH